MLNNNIEVLIKDINETAYYYQIGQENKGSLQLIQVCDKTDQLLKALIKINNLNINKYINILNKRLLEIIQALQREDYIFIADLLEYEITPVLNQLETI